MFRPRVAVLSVLEKPAAVGQPVQVIEHRPRERRGGIHAATRALIRSPAKSR